MHGKNINTYKAEMQKREGIKPLGILRSGLENNIKRSVKGKGKGHPRTGHEGPDGEQMYSSTLPSTSALDGSGWSTPRPGRFTPRKDPIPTV